MASLAEPLGHVALSERERAVLLLAADGMTDKEIAIRLQIGPKTVRTYWDRMRQKMSAASRTQVLAKALRAAYDDLNHREKRWRTIVDALPVLVIGFDDSYHITYCNQEARRFLGYEPEQLSDHSIYDRMFPDPRTRSQFLQDLCGRGGDYADRRAPVVCHDGVIREISWYSCARRNPVPGWRTWAAGIESTASKDLIESAVRLL